MTEILVGGNAWRRRGLFGRLAAAVSGNAVHVPWREVDEVSSVVKLKRHRTASCGSAAATIARPGS